MNIILRGMMVHILLKDNTNISEIIQDSMSHPPEKYHLEIHIDINQEVISLIFFKIGPNIENLINILEYFAKKYSKIQDPKYDSICRTFLQIIKELRKKKILFPRNLFQFDIE
ncbi:MAG: hypothetical protein ACFFD2_11900 [Promethearchaeota archaeon]